MLPSFVKVVKVKSSVAPIYEGFFIYCRLIVYEFDPSALTMLMVTVWLSVVSPLQTLLVETHESREEMLMVEGNYIWSMKLAPRSMLV